MSMLFETDPTWEFFIRALGPNSGEPIGAAPQPEGSAHITAKLKPLHFVLAYVRPTPKTPKSMDFARILAEDLARTFYAEVYGRPEGGGRWALLASARELCAEAPA